MANDPPDWLEFHWHDERNAGSGPEALRRQRERDAFERARALYAAGHADAAFQVLEQGCKRILLSAESFPDDVVSAETLLLAAQAQMQRGRKAASFKLAFRAERLFRRNQSVYWWSLATQFLGLSLHQQRRFSAAARAFAFAAAGLERKRDQSLRKHILFDGALSAAYDARVEHRAPDEVLVRSLKEKARYFAGEEPSFGGIADVRIAEVLLMRHEVHPAAELLDVHESSVEKFILPFQALFYRINAERYVLQGDAERANYFYSEALSLDASQHYMHQLEELFDLQHVYRDVFGDHEQRVLDALWKETQ